VPDQPELAVSILDSKIQGAPTAACRRADGFEFFLHSPENPVAEARRLAAAAPSRERTLYVVLGFGLGYHVRELLERVPRSSHVLVLEPDSACLSGRLAASGNRSWAWISDRRLHRFAHHDPGVAPSAIADRMASLRLLSLEMLVHDPSTLTAEAFYGALREGIPREFPISFASRIGSLDKMLENHLANFWANLPSSWEASPVETLRGRWAGRALILVSAGPSLTPALPCLGEAGGKALLLATGTAVRTLLDNRIRPDLVISTDPYPANLGHFQGWDTSGVPLVYHHQIYRGIPEEYRGPKFWFAMQDDPPVPLARDRERSGFRQGGSVAFSALQLAHYMEADPIIFVGQDFAFADGHTHARGCIVDQPYRAEALPADYLRVPGVSGEPVPTSRLYYWYLLFMQDYLREYGRKKPGIRHINTSRTGALIRGMEALDLRQALAEAAPVSSPSPGQMIVEAFARGRRKPPEACKRALDRWARELERLPAACASADEFDRLAARCRALSFYAQAARLYDDVRYLYEVRSLSLGAPFQAEFRSRFVAHLRWLREELIRMRDTA